MKKNIFGFFLNKEFSNFSRIFKGLKKISRCCNLFSGIFDHIFSGFDLKNRRKTKDEKNLKKGFEGGLEENSKLFVLRTRHQVVCEVLGFQERVVCGNSPCAEQVVTL